MVVKRFQKGFKMTKNQLFWRGIAMVDCSTIKRLKILRSSKTRRVSLMCCVAIAIVVVNSLEVETYTGPEMKTFFENKRWPAAHVILVQIVNLENLKIYFLKKQDAQFGWINRCTDLCVKNLFLIFVLHMRHSWSENAEKCRVCAREQTNEDSGTLIY